jgi:hypothetical protein
MRSTSLRILRLACFALLGLWVFAWLTTSKGEPPAWLARIFAAASNAGDLKQHRVDAALAALWSILPFALLVAIGALKTTIPKAEKRDEEDWARRQKEHEIADATQRDDKLAREAAAAAERSRRTGEVRASAINIARSQYTQYVDIDALEELGWHDAAYEASREDFREGTDDPISLLLDPPELVIKYRAQGETRDDELRLYLRERVERLESHPQFVEYHGRVMAHRAERERAASLDRQQLAEQRKREQAEAEAAIQKGLAEQADEQERNQRLAQQKVVRLDAR